MRGHRALLLLLVGLVLLGSCGGDPAPPPDVNLVLLNGRIWTGDTDAPWTEALAIAGGRIVASGDSDAIALLAGEAETVNLGRGLVLPGFIDTHADLFSPWLQQDILDLSTIRSRRQLATRLRAAARTHAPGAWLRGRDWDQRLWEGPLPDRGWIDDATPDHPTWLVQRDAALGLANAVALERAGVTPATPGARLADDDTLTGILEQDAFRQLEAALPRPSAAARDRALETALSLAASRGVTSVHHLGTWEDLAELTRAEEAGRLSARVYAAIPADDWLQLDRAIGAGVFDDARRRGADRLRVGAVHATLDGSLAARSAAFVSGYADAPGSSGQLISSLERLASQLEGADRADLQILLRATGDLAVATALDLHATLATRVRRDRRLRVQTAQHLRPLDIARFGAEQVLVSALPYSVLREGRWIDDQLGGDRARTSFPYRQLLDAGAVVTFGGGRLDEGSPLDGIYAAVTRRTLDGLHPQGWVPEERISVEEALRAYTSAAAYAGFQEADTGRLTVGRWADLALVDRDLLTVAPRDIPLVRVILTMVGGEIVFDRRPAEASPGNPTTSRRPSSAPR